MMQMGVELRMKQGGKKKYEALVCICKEKSKRKKRKKVVVKGLERDIGFKPFGSGK